MAIASVGGIPGFHIRPGSSKIHHMATWRLVPPRPCRPLDFLTSRAAFTHHDQPD